MKTDRRRMKRLLGTGAAAIVMAAMLAPAAFARPALLPDVTAEMCSPEYWQQGHSLLADRGEIRALNELFLETEGLNMTDLTKKEELFDGKDLNRLLWKSSMAEASSYLSGGYYSSDGESVTGPFLTEALLNIENKDAAEEQELRYGICVTRSDIRALPSDEIVTDAKKDNDFDYFQLSAIRVNEPVLIRSVSADGRYYYCDTIALSGWIPSEDIAVCKDREEWTSAWNIPDDKVLVVTGGKFFLESSNTSPEISNRMLTMGTVLEMADPADQGELVTNRSVIHNHVVWLPVRKEDGSYGREPALISEHQPVHEGYLPLTSGNILETAFSMLGDAYGWGGMLDSNDCSGYLRDVYRCFGFELPRNTTWQSAMPVYKSDMSGMTAEEKKAVLDGMPAGTLLYFNGHGMMYLGHEGGRYYVISSFSSMMDPDGVTRRRVRSVSVNTLDTLRANGNTWLEDIHTALVPWRRAPEAKSGDKDKLADGPVLTEKREAPGRKLTDGPVENGSGGRKPLVVKTAR